MTNPPEEARRWRARRDFREGLHCFLARFDLGEGANFGNFGNRLQENGSRSGMGVFRENGFIAGANTGTFGKDCTVFCPLRIRWNERISGISGIVFRENGFIAGANTGTFGKDCTVFRPLRIWWNERISGISGIVFRENGFIAGADTGTFGKDCTVFAFREFREPRAHRFVGPGRSPHPSQAAPPQGFGKDCRVFHVEETASKGFGKNLHRSQPRCSTTMFPGAAGNFGTECHVSRLP